MSKNKKIIIILSTTIFVVLLYNMSLNIWIEKYNDRQWNTYLTSFNKVKEVADPYIKCLATLEEGKELMQKSYEKKVSYGSNTLTKKEIYESNMYGFLRNVTKDIAGDIRDYIKETPSIKAGIFILDSWSLKSPILNPFSVIKRVPETKEPLSWHINHFENYEITGIKKLYCPNFTTEADRLFSFPLSKESCTELLKIHNSLEREPQEEDYELGVEYQTALERYERKQKNRLDLCKDPEFLLEFSGRRYN